MRTLARIVTALALSLAMGAAFAQAPPAPTMVFQGNVMVSTPTGEFVTAVNGQTVAAGQTIMVPPGGSATMTYPNGSVASFGAGTHAVPAMGAAAGAAGAGALAAAAVGPVSIVAATVALTATAVDQAVVEDDDDDSPDEPPPVSP